MLQQIMAAPTIPSCNNYESLYCLEDTWLDFLIPCFFTNSTSQCFLRGVRHWQLCIHISYCFCKILLCLRSLNLVEYKKTVRESLLINTCNNAIALSFLKLNTCLKGRSKQTILQRKWFMHQSHSFCKFKTSQLQIKFISYE